MLHFLNDTGILATFIQRGLEQNASFARSIQLVPRNRTKKIKYEQMVSFAKVDTFHDFFQAKKMYH